MVKKSRNIIGLAVLVLVVMVCVVFQAHERGYIKTGSDTVYNDKENQNRKREKTGKEKKKNNVASVKNDKNDSSQAKKQNTAKNNRYGDNPELKVLITTTGYTSLFHDKVCIKSSKPFEVVYGKKVKKYKGGSKVVFKSSERKKKNKKVVVRSCSNAKLRVMSVKRQDGRPAYRGRFEIKWTKNGLLLKNIVPLEQYLYSVVPSEMPSGSDMSALKAQAVCARSFAYSKLDSAKYKKYGAHVDDSVACQVYNNIFEDKRTIKAVNDTKDIVMMTKDKKVALGYYFATSWGCTADGKEVWDTEQAVSYLKRKLQVSNKSKGSRRLNLSDENLFRNFISKNVYSTYDSSDQWYRWKTNIKKSSLSSRIDSLLYSCYTSDKNSVLTQNKSGKYRKVLLKSIGKIRKIRVEKREKSGLVTELVIVGKKRVVKVRGQYNVRKVLAPIYENIKRKDGSKVSGMKLLPSAAFYIDMIKKGNKEIFVIKGGGFGHGSGMSQTGACNMAEAGYDYKSILTHYYDGIIVDNISKSK